VSNVDLLEAFAEEERKECSSCGQRACVTLPEVATCFCLNCGAVTIGGMRIDTAREISLGI
jgi:predicted RNA-binding Zn-ribbon protein involved in translation (DUF1610 family)